MWPFSTYPEKTAGDVAGKTFDYIIVGGACHFPRPKAIKSTNPKTIPQAVRQDV